ncbi:MAG TPA: hypothetical protein DIS79_08850 [Bacteroidetes bacterium]|nr:hypothetical protein [Bacteroidota bacterium]HRK06042.1 heparan-alpha-glucosaminide N-acetyltransferase domain-containing protein [Chlorobiota bacterium]
MKQTAEQRQRFVFLDILRGIAAIWMIQVHVTNQLLDVSYKDSWFYDVVNISNGFVAPTFVFCAGAGLWIALSRKGDEWRRFSPSLFDYLRRLAIILFWAYMLHVPFYSFDRTIYATREELLPFFQSDVLHVIVYTSLAVLVTFLLTSSLRRTSLLAGIGAILIMIGTKFFWNTSPADWLVEPISRMVLPAPYSPFPLLPWACYLLAGVAVASLFFSSTDKGRMGRWFLIGGLLLPVALFTFKNTVVTPWTDTWWTTSPGVHLFRICGTLVLWGGLFLIEDKLSTSRLAQYLKLVGTESLFVYVAHLLVVYGNTADFLRSTFHIGTTDWWGSFLGFVIICVPTLLVMSAWHNYKRNHPNRAKKLTVLVIVGMVVGFVVG